LNAGLNPTFTGPAPGSASDSAVKAAVFHRPSTQIVGRDNYFKYNNPEPEVPPVP
jgi:hypothetical protein